MAQVHSTDVSDVPLHHSLAFDIFFLYYFRTSRARSIWMRPYAKKRVCNLSIDIQSSDSRLHIRQFQMQEARKKIKCKIVVQELIGPRVKVNGQPKNSMQLKAWWIIHKRDADSFIRSFAHVFLILCCLFLFCLVTSIIDHSIKCDVDKLFSKWAILSNSWAYICLCVRVAAECQLLFGRNTAATLYIFFIVRGYANWCWLLIKCSSIHFMFPCVDGIHAYEFCHDLVSYTVSTDSSTDVLDWHWQCVWSIESEVNVRAARNDNKKKIHSNDGLPVGIWTTRCPPQANALFPIKCISSAITNAYTRYDLYIWILNSFESFFSFSRKCSAYFRFGHTNETDRCFSHIFLISDFVYWNCAQSQKWNAFTCSFVYESYENES